jgi:hypothetical protein
MSIKVTVTGRSSSPFRRFSWQADARRWSDEIDPLVRDAIKREAPVGQGPTSGKLRESVRYERHMSAHNAQLLYTSSTPYARFVVDGTRPHIIRPRRARALRWEGPGGPRFARLVHHPGTRANPFPTRALRPMVPLIQRRLAEIVRSNLRG